MDQLVDDARRMPAGSVRFARGISNVWTPDQLVPLRERVRKDHRAQLFAIHEAINERFGTTGASDDYVNVFYAASEMAPVEWSGGTSCRAMTGASCASSGTTCSLPMPDADGFLSYSEALSALMRHLDQRVMVSAAGHDDADAGLVVQATGTLTAVWDPGVIEANQVGDVCDLPPGRR